MRNLANKEIEVLNAVTRVNSTSKNSFLTGKTIKIKKGGFVNRTDGCFYRTTINEKEYKIFCDFMENKMYLNEVNNSKAKTIIINAYRLTEEEITNEAIYTLSSGGGDIGFITQKQFDEFIKLKKITFYRDDERYPMYWSDNENLFYSLTKQTNIDLNNL